MFKTLQGINATIFAEHKIHFIVFSKAIASSIGHGLSESNVNIEEVKNCTMDSTELSYQVSYSVDELRFIEVRESVKILMDCLFTNVYNGGFDAYLSDWCEYSKKPYKCTLSRCKSASILLDY